MNAACNTTNEAVEPFYKFFLYCFLVDNPILDNLIQLTFYQNSVFSRDIFFVFFLFCRPISQDEILRKILKSCFLPNFSTFWDYYFEPKYYYPNFLSSLLYIRELKLNCDEGACKLMVIVDGVNCLFSDFTLVHRFVTFYIIFCYRVSLSLPFIVTMYCHLYYLYPELCTLYYRKEWKFITDSDYIFTLAFATILLLLITIFIFVYILIQA